MRRLFLSGLGLLLVVPFGAVAQVEDTFSQFHLNYVNGKYYVTFTTPLPVPTSQVEASYKLPDGQIVAAELFRGDWSERGGVQIYQFEMPPDAVSYTVEEQTFDVRAHPPALTDSFRIAFLADHGRTANSSAILQAIAKANVSLVLIGGDLGYAEGKPNEWDEWFNLIQLHAAHVPWMPARGNHEGRCLGPVTGGVPRDCTTDEEIYLTRWHLPGKDLYYSFDWGPLRIASLDTEAYYHRTHPVEKPVNIDPDVQRRWLREALRDPDDAWSLVFFHRPIYSSNGGHGSDLQIREHLLPALDERRVDLVLQAHDHDYERSFPLRNDSVVTRTNDTVRGDGTVYVVSGGGGKSLYETWQATPDWSAARDSVFHFLLIDVSFDQLRVQAITETGEVLDSFTITRPATAPPKTESPSGGSSPGFGVGELLTLVVVATVAVFVWSRRQNR